MKTIAIAKDKNRFWQVYQNILQRYGLQTVLLDVYLKDERDRLLEEPFDAFIWRARHTPISRNLARRLLYLTDVELKIPTFPSWRAFWHYDDKIAQYFVFKKLNIRVPQTYLFFNKKEAFEFCDRASYPLIYKSASGASSSNVGLLKNKWQAKFYVWRAFERGIKTYFRADLQKDYVMFQEFLPNNEGDYRLVCLGNTISGFFRYNREKTPLASGSGKFDCKELPVDLLDYVYEIHKRSGYFVMSYDLIKNQKDEWVVTEMSVIYGGLDYDIYDKAPVYQRDEKGQWRQIKPKLNRHERFIQLLLQNWDFIG